MAATEVAKFNPQNTFPKIHRLYETLNKKTLKCSPKEFRFVFDLNIHLEINIKSVNQQDYFEPIESKRKQKRKK